MSGLSISDVVAVNVQLTPTAAAVRTLNYLLVLGSTLNVIDTTERLRFYANNEAVQADFGTSAPEALAAEVWFEQDPQPDGIYIGKFAQVATKGRLLGASLSAAQQALANFTVVTAGSLKLNINGTPVEADTIDLSGATNMLDVATALSTAFTTHATCSWNATYNRFEFYSNTFGSTSSVSFAVTPSTGTDLEALMLLRSTDGGRIATGSAIETPAAGAAACMAASGGWYALTFAPVSVLAAADYEAVAPVVEAAYPLRMFGITSQDGGLLSGAGPDLATILQGATYNRTTLWYSSMNPFTVVSILAYMLTVDFEGSDTMVTAKFKTLPGVLPEVLTEAQAATLLSKNCNVYVTYANAVAITQEGIMCGGYYIDERIIADNFATDLQSNEFNLLYTQPKVPQTDAGVNMLAAVADSTCEQYVDNGAFAPGIWTGPPVGPLKTGQTLPKGYLVYYPPLASQNSSDRAARKAPTSQIAAKLAGAIHSANVLVSFNR